jgi:WYL domain
MERTSAPGPARLVHLRLLLLWEGQLKRGRLMELFGLSQVRASEWIRSFRTLNPTWMRWDSKARSYQVTPAAYAAHAAERAALAQWSIAHYVALTGLPDGNVITASPAYAAFREFAAPNPRLFAQLRQAIVAGHAVALTYRSMREPAPHLREIEPHSLVRAGPRWHVRAYSLDHQDYRDFSLGRIVNVKPLLRSATHRAGDDPAWTTMVKLRLVAHPELSSEQQDLVRFEYFNDTSARVETCRGALVAYLVQELRVAFDPKQQRPPDYLLAVQNFKDIKPWLFPH